ncbi:MAG TPA: acyl-CoA dehydrogenase family protein, partial [Aeromicrobium sp.]|nr:acyl-CoA dehydrogenase family protein [Aeromicrobium sp.]
MDLTLTQEQRDFVAAARDFLTREAVPHRVEWDRAECIDPAFIPRMGQMGFFGLTVPEEYGGVGGDLLTYVLAMEELGRADSSLRGLASVSLGLVGSQILAWGTEEQKHRWLPGITAGTGLACFGLTEPDTGSDAGSLKTTARLDGDH